MADRASRRLAAVLAADVVGYSRLIGADEAGTLDALRQLRNEVFEPAATDAGGTVVKRMGDGWLVEFPSVGDAVACALKVQRHLECKDTLHLRIGVHLGDITHEDEDIYGDGVNIAARLQQTAAPGSVLISDIAWRSLDAACAADFRDAGQRQLKNIDRPVRLFAWGDAADPTPEAAHPHGIIVAVLPFRTVSDTGDADLLREGIHTDLTDSISRLKWLRVIASGTTRQYAADDRNIAAIMQELNADYLLEGDLRKAGERVRATVRLIEAATGTQLSADRFEGRYADLFDLQDEIVALVVRMIEPNLMEAEHEALKRRPTRDIGLWPQIVALRRAAYSYHPEDLERALELADSILDADPNNAYACGLAAYALNVQIVNNWYGNPNEGRRRLEGYLQRGMTLDPTNEYCRTLIAAGELFARNAWTNGTADNTVDAVRRLEAVVADDPSTIVMRIILAMAYARQGRCADALQETKVAERLSPRDPLLFLFYQTRGLAALFGGDHEQAIDYSHRAIMLQPNYLASHRVLIAALVAAGRAQEAQEAVAAMLAISPNETAAKIRAGGFTTEKTINAMVSAGLPED